MTNQQLDFLELLERPTVEALAKPDRVFESDDWKFVVGHPENTRFERKSAKVEGKVLAEALSAFGNGPAVEGGVLVIGIEKDGTVSGCSRCSDEKLQKLEFMGRDHCPEGGFVTNRLGVTNSLGKSDFIIRARIHFVENKIVDLTNGEAFVLESDRSRRLTESEKQEIRINKGERAFELEGVLLNTRQISARN
jgi:ATP-dependent DNA helicase RecG